MADTKVTCENNDLVSTFHFKNKYFFTSTAGTKKLEKLHETAAMQVQTILFTVVVMILRYHVYYTLYFTLKNRSDSAYIRKTQILDKLDRTT